MEPHPNNIIIISTCLFIRDKDNSSIKNQIHVIFQYSFQNRYAHSKIVKCGIKCFIQTANNLRCKTENNCFVKITHVCLVRLK